MPEVAKTNEQDQVEVEQDQAEAEQGQAEVEQVQAQAEVEADEPIRTYKARQEHHYEREPEVQRRKSGKKQKSG